MKHTQHLDCTILRVKTITEYSMNLDTGAFTEQRTYTATEPCQTPLFSELEIKTGICRNCREGWEAEGNTFAFESERKRAAASKA